MMLKVPAGLSSPMIDVGEARWASEQLEVLIRHVGIESMTALVVQQAQRELESLVRSVDPTGSTVMGPFRVPKAA